jgi:hypothetical protein
MVHINHGPWQCPLLLPPPSAPPEGTQAKTLAAMKSVMRGMKAAMAAANRKVQEMRAEEREISRQLKEMDDGEDSFSDWDAPSGSVSRPPFGGCGWVLRGCWVPMCVCVCASVVLHGFHVCGVSGWWSQCKVLCGV